jgi:hypothetical protein
VVGGSFDAGLVRINHSMGACPIALPMTSNPSAASATGIMLAFVLVDDGVTDEKEAHDSRRRRIIRRTIRGGGHETVI